jgi:polysaccharide biosynthesis protein PelC
MRPIFLAAALGAAAALAGCAPIQHSPSPALSCAEKWAVLPFHNYSETPQAGQAVARLVENGLRSRGLGDLRFYPANLEDSLGEFGMTQGQYERALDWAKGQGARYGVTGSVTEWRYKSGMDGEPAVGLTLEVVDVESGKALWSAGGARTGWSSDALTGTGLKLVRTLLSKASIPCN